MKKLIASLGAVTLALGIVVFGAALGASAHDKAASITCTTASVSLTNYDQGATALIVVDGVMKQGIHGTNGDVGTGFGGHFVATYPLTSDADHTSHRLQVTVISTDGARYNLNFDQTVTGCYTPPPATVVLPEGSFTPASCTASASYTLPVLPDTAKYALNTDGSRPVAGTFPLAAGQTVTVTAHTLASANVVQVSKTYGPYVGADQLPISDPSCHNPLPEPKVVTSDWQDGTYACGDTTQVQTRTVTTTTYSYDDQYNIVSSDKVVTEHQTVPLTDAQIAALNCPVITPPTPPTDTTPVVPTSHTTPTVHELAHTNIGDQTIPALIGYGIVTAGLTLLAVGLILRRREGAR